MSSEVIEVYSLAGGSEDDVILFIELCIGCDRMKYIILLLVVGRIHQKRIMSKVSGDSWGGLGGLFGCLVIDIESLEC